MAVVFEKLDSGWAQLTSGHQIDLLEDAARLQACNDVPCVHNHRSLEFESLAAFLARISPFSRSSARCQTGVKSATAHEKFQVLGLSSVHITTPRHLHNNHFLEQDALGVEPY